MSTVIVVAGGAVKTLFIVAHTVPLGSIMDSTILSPLHGWLFGHAGVGSQSVAYFSPGRRSGVFGRARIAPLRSHVGLDVVEHAVDRLVIALVGRWIRTGLDLGCLCLVLSTPTGNPDPR